MSSTFFIVQNIGPDLKTKICSQISWLFIAKPTILTNNVSSMSSSMRVYWPKGTFISNHLSFEHVPSLSRTPWYTVDIFVTFTTGTWSVIRLCVAGKKDTLHCHQECFIVTYGSQTFKATFRATFRSIFTNLQSGSFAPTWLWRKIFQDAKTFRKVKSKSVRNFSDSLKQKVCSALNCKIG